MLMRPVKKKMVVHTVYHGGKILDLLLPNPTLSYILPPSQNKFSQGKKE